MISYLRSTYTHMVEKNGTRIFRHVRVLIVRPVHPPAITEIRAALAHDHPENNLLGSTAESLSSPVDICRHASVHVSPYDKQRRVLSSLRSLIGSALTRGTVSARLSERNMWSLKFCISPTSEQRNGEDSKAETNQEEGKENGSKKQKTENVQSWISLALQTNSTHNYKA
eukprot:749955-Hanusia_phi.AAC.3